MKSKLEKLKACREAIEWCGNRTPERAYTECERGDWLLWMAPRSGVDPKLVTLASCDCANTVKHLTKDKTPGRLLRLVRKWVKGEATQQEVKKLADATNKRAISADERDENEEAYYILMAAVYAADATKYPLEACYAATAAVATTRYTGVDREVKHRELADVVRKRIPFEKFA
jgi:hypothetical protein